MPLIKLVGRASDGGRGRSDAVRRGGGRRTVWWLVFQFASTLSQEANVSRCYEGTVNGVLVYHLVFTASIGGT